MRFKSLSFLAGILFLLSGCATAHKQKDLEVQGLKNQITVLEAQIQSKDDEIRRLTEEKNAQEKTIEKKKVITEVKSRPNIRQVQIALKNANLNPGPIDGRMGKQTREAIRAFQKANNLAVDGKVGRVTWNLLKEYLYQKIK